MSRVDTNRMNGRRPKPETICLFTPAMWSPDQQLLHPLKTYYRCGNLGPTPDLLTLQVRTTVSVLLSCVCKVTKAVNVGIALYL